MSNKLVLKYLIAWRFMLFVFLIFALSFLPLQDHHLGGGKKLYLINPFLWSFINFDGEHYLSVAQKGYGPLQYFYFPTFPVIVRLFTKPITDNIWGYAIIGTMLSHLFTILGIIGLAKLSLLDYKKATVRHIIFLTLAFPASFYLVSYYTESMFLALSVWSFYFARNKKWAHASVLASIATATRIVGITLLPALFVEMLLQRKGQKKFNYLQFAYLLIIPIGLLSYLYYLKYATGNALIFLHNVEIFGEQRSSSFILLPQVYYRYIFKILPNTTSYLPMAFTIILEFTIASFVTLASVFKVFKIRPSYWVFMVLCFLIPTLAGSFSSMPRYVSVIFPIFMIGGNWLATKERPVQITIYVILVAVLGVATSLFTRGYWLS